MPLGLMAQYCLANPLCIVQPIHESQFVLIFHSSGPGQVLLNLQPFLLSSIVCLDSGKINKSSENRIRDSCNFWAE